MLWCHKYLSYQHTAMESGSRINPPSLAQWAEDHLRAIFSAVSEDVYGNAFDGFVAKHAHITVNGRHLSREHYKSLLHLEKVFELSAGPAQLSFQGVVEVPADEEHPTCAGNVGLLYKAVVTCKDVICGALNSSTVHSSLNLVIEQDDSLVPPESGYFDARRVTHLSEVVMDQDNHIILPSPLATASNMTSSVVRAPA